MPETPKEVIKILRTTSKPKINEDYLIIDKGKTEPEIDTVYRLYFRRLVEKVDANNEPTGKTIYTTDFGNYFEGTLLLVNRDQLRLNLTSTNFNEHICGPVAQELWQKAGDDSIEWSHWVLAKLTPPEEAVSPRDMSEASFSPTLLFLVPLLAIASWIINTRMAHLVGGAGILMIIGFFAVQPSPWMNQLVEE